MSAPSETVIVVPCFDEAARLKPAIFEDFAGAHPHVRFVFVDDGSTDTTRALFAEPFVANWTFHVELLARLVAANRRGAAPDLREAVREVPLHQWHHVGGSKIRASDFLRALVEVRRIRARYLR